MTKSWKIYLENARLGYQKRWNKLKIDVTSAASKRAMKDTLALVFTESSFRTVSNGEGIFWSSWQIKVYDIAVILLCNQFERFSIKKK